MSATQLWLGVGLLGQAFFSSRFLLAGAILLAAGLAGNDESLRTATRPREKARAAAMLPP
jgi:hypothetical protein